MLISSQAVGTRATYTPVAARPRARPTAASGAVEAGLLVLADPKAEAFRSWKCSKMGCCDSALACQIAEEQCPDVVVTRLRQQSSMTGIEVAQRLKSSPATREIPVVIITTSILSTHREARYSVRSAITGSTREARRAGM